MNIVNNFCQKLFQKSIMLIIFAITNKNTIMPNEENNSGTEQKVKINNHIQDNEAFKRKLASDIEENIEIVSELMPMLKSVDFTQFDENALIQIVTKMKQTRMLFKQLTEQ